MKLKLIGTAIIVIICFLCIHAGYNEPFDSLFMGLLWLIKTEGVTFSFDSLPLQFFLSAGILIAASVLGKKRAVAVGIVFMIALVGYWIYLLQGAIEFNYLSMIPFLFVSSFGIWFCVRPMRDK